MTPQDATSTLRKVSALRELCLRLPHLPTLSERELLRRFGNLVQAPDGITAADVEALVAGWRQWWRDGNVGVLSRMAGQLPAGYADTDRRLAGLSLAARLARWGEIQARIWRCTTCSAHPRVEVNVRQQTDLPSSACKLLVVSLAPPHAIVARRIQARSATNTADDALRLFLERALDLSWRELAARGLVLLHAVKCAIRPNAGGFQEPPSRVVDSCAPQHLSDEIDVLKPPIVATLGRMAYRAVVQSLSTPSGGRGTHLRLFRWPREADAQGEGYNVRLPEGSFTLFAGPFIRGARQSEAARVVRRAAATAGILRE